MATDSESIMIISNNNDAQLSSTTTTKITRYFSVPSMLIFSTIDFLSLRPSSSLSSLRLPHSFLTFRAPSIAFHLLICLAHDAKSLTVLAISLSSILSHLIDKKKKNSEAARAVISRTFGGGTVQTLEVFRSHFPRNVLTSLSLNHAAFPDLTSQAGHQTLMS